MSTFKGFCPEGFDLLVENRLANDKDFYESKKKEIREKVINPFHALCNDMSEEMLKIDPLFVTNPTRMLCRVRRDTRYTKDKTLYRDNLWFYFRRPKTNFEPVPFYYMEVTPEYWSYGCFGGFGKGEMEIAREMILKQDANFLSAFDCANKSKVFSLDGEMYKRDRFKDAKEEFKPWLNRKHIGLAFYEYDDYSPLWDGSFVKPMLDSFKEIAPFYNFLLTIRERVNAERHDNTK